MIVFTAAIGMSVPALVSLTRGRQFYYDSPGAVEAPPVTAQVTAARAGSQGGGGRISPQPSASQECLRDQGGATGDAGPAGRSPMRFARTRQALGVITASALVPAGLSSPRTVRLPACPA